MIPADKGINSSTTTTTVTADPGQGPIGCPETDTQRALGATAGAVHQQWPQPWCWVSAHVEQTLLPWLLQGQAASLPLPHICLGRAEGGSGAPGLVPLSHGPSGRAWQPALPSCAQQEDTDSGSVALVLSDLEPTCAPKCRDGCHLLQWKSRGGRSGIKGTKSG